MQQVYARRVQDALQRAGSGLTVHNAGIGGNTTRDAPARFERDVLAHKPRLIVLQFGINDSAVDVWKNPPATDRACRSPTLRRNLRAMIDRARKQEAKVILMTTNPLRWTPKLKEMYGKPPYRPEAEDGFETPFLSSYNEAIRKISRELDIPLIDVHADYPGFAAERKTTVDQLLLDGMHPNDLGHELVARLLVPVIRAQTR